MTNETPAPPWLIAAVEAEDGMFISAGTGRGDYDPEKSRAAALLKITPDDLALVKNLVERYSKIEVIDVIASLK